MHLASLPAHAASPEGPCLARNSADRRTCLGDRRGALVPTMQYSSDGFSGAPPGISASSCRSPYDDAPLRSRSARSSAQALRSAAGILDGEAARGHAFVGTVRSARGQHADPLQRDTELFGGDLREGGEDALAELDLAARDRYRAVALEMHALRQAPRVRQRRRLLNEHRGSHAPRGCATRSGRDSCPERSGFSLPRAIFRSRGARRRSSRCRSCSNRTARPGGARAPFCTGCSPFRPSIVVIFLLTAKDNGISHDAMARPSTSTKHAPHWPLPQPKRVPMSPRWLRRT